MLLEAIGKYMTTSAIWNHHTEHFCVTAPFISTYHCLIIQQGQAQLQEKTISLGKIVKIFRTTDSRKEEKKKEKKKGGGKLCEWLSFRILNYFYFFSRFKKKETTQDNCFFSSVVLPAVTPRYTCNSDVSVWLFRQKGPAYQIHWRPGLHLLYPRNILSQIQMLSDSRP